MILAAFLFLLFSVLCAAGAGWIIYLTKARIAPALVGALVTLLVFAALAIGLIQLLRAGMVN